MSSSRKNNTCVFASFYFRASFISLQGGFLGFARNDNTHETASTIVLSLSFRYNKDNRFPTCRKRRPPMTSFLLLTAIVIFACVFLNRVSDKLGIPVLLAFILLGMFFGSDIPSILLLKTTTLPKRSARPHSFSSCSTGASGRTDYGKACRRPCDRTFECGRRRDSPLTGGFIHFILGEPWLLSFLMGSVIASTDAASVFSILRAKRLNLASHRLAPRSRERQ